MKHGVPTEKQDNYITKYAEKIFTAHFRGLEGEGRRTDAPVKERARHAIINIGAA
jgi:hypothetical protein